VRDVNDFRSSLWLTVDADLAVEILHHVEVGNITNGLDVYAASIFRVKINTLIPWFLNYAQVSFKHTHHWKFSLKV
jgi:hypothetical protein